MLARIRKSMEEKDEGFTLIELLVVIIIIGILAAIAIPVFLNQRKKAVEAGMKSDLRSVANELETYYTDNQQYPVNTTVTQAAKTVTVGTGGSTVRLSDPQSTFTMDALGAGGESYCLHMTNTKVGGAGWSYGNTTGGLQKGAVCS
jgi:prepilin-type N-terminal cleavage/methylation domain-containing protein